MNILAEYEPSAISKYIRKCSSETERRKFENAMFFYETKCKFKSENQAPIRGGRVFAYVITPIAPKTK